MEDMTEDEVLDFVRLAWFANVGLADGNRAYVLPIFYGYDATSRTFYFHSHHGVKDAFIESTEEACMTITRAEAEDYWASVMAFGTVETVTMETELRTAMDALMRAPLPPEYGFTETGEPKRGGRDLQFWKLKVTRMTGRKSTPPAPD